MNTILYILLDMNIRILGPLKFYDLRALHQFLKGKKHASGDHRFRS